MERMFADTVEYTDRSEATEVTLQGSSSGLARFTSPSFFGRFYLQHPIGSGRQGHVYLARYRPRFGDSRLVAIKLARAGDVHAVTALQHEVRLVRGLSHSNIVKWVDSGRINGVEYFAMEWINGWSIRQFRTLDITPLARSLDWSIQLCDALEACHTRRVNGYDAPIIHCDLKADNVLITRCGRVKLVDFGIALDSATEQKIRPHVMGTAAYMAPEQISMSPLDARTDLFSAGALIYEFATGRRLFEGAPLAELLWQRLNVDQMLHNAHQWAVLRKTCPELVPIVQRCVRKNPSERFPSARALACRLRRLSSRLFGET